MGWGFNRENPTQLRVPAGPQATPVQAQGQAQQPTNFWDWGLFSNFGNGSQPGTKNTAIPHTPLDLGDLQLTPEMQAYFDTLGRIHFGAGAMPDRVPLPNAPVIGNDPGLEMLGNERTRIGKETLGELERMRGDLNRDNPQDRSPWLRLGEWLGMVGERGWGEAGSSMAEMLNRDREASRQIREEASRLMLQGFGVEDAMAQARASVLSGNHQTQVQNQQNQFNVDTGNAQGQNQWNLAGWQESNATAARQAQVQMQIAEATREAYTQARQQRQALLQPFLSIPGYEGDALRGIYGDQLPQGAVDVLTRNMTNDQRAMQLYMFIQGMGDEGRAATFLQRFDPTINRDMIQQNPAGAVMRALQSPNAAQVYESIAPTLRLSNGFAAAQAPAGR